MVVPCLTCTHLGKYEYTVNKERDYFYDYHLSCQCGISIPDPAPKEGFSCEKYENKLATMPRMKRSECAIEVKNE